MSSDLGLSGLSLSSAKPDFTMSPASAALDSSFQGFLQQAPSTPVYHQNSQQQQLIRHQSLDVNDPRLGNIGVFPGNNSLNFGMRNQQTPQFPPGDFINSGSFLHSPNLNSPPADKAQGGFSPLDNFNPGLNTLFPRGLLAPMSPVKPICNEIGRERSYSTPEPSYNHFPLGVISPASASTNILYEDKPFLSPSSTTDWQNSRPPRHGSGSMVSTTDNPGLLLPFPGMMRHTVSDGSFCKPLGGGVVASKSFEASLQKVQLNSTTSFGSLGAER